jgi:hypothetical protein
MSYSKQYVYGDKKIPVIDEEAIQKRLELLESELFIMAANAKRDACREDVIYKEMYMLKSLNRGLPC